MRAVGRNPYYQKWVVKVRAALSPYPLVIGPLRCAAVLISEQWRLSFFPAEKLVRWRGFLVMAVVKRAHKHTRSLRPVLVPIMWLGCLSIRPADVLWTSWPSWKGHKESDKLLWWVPISISGKHCTNLPWRNSWRNWPEGTRVSTFSSIFMTLLHNQSRWVGLVLHQEHETCLFASPRCICPLRVSSIIFRNNRSGRSLVLPSLFSRREA